MSSKWDDSSLPFYVVMRPWEEETHHGHHGHHDHHDHHHDHRHHHHDGTHDNAERANDASDIIPEYLYPEVRYIFDDDDFSPSIEVLEQQPDDISVIIDFDHDGRTILNYESLSPYWQAVKVSTSSSAAPSWASSTSYSNWSTSIFIDGIGTDSPAFTSSSSTFGAPTGNSLDLLKDIKARIRQFQVRNEQLRKIVQDKEYPK